MPNNPNHPSRGSRVAAKTIRAPKDIETIKTSGWEQAQGLFSDHIWLSDLTDGIPSKVNKFLKNCGIQG